MIRRIKSGLLIFTIATLFLSGLLLAFSPLIRDWMINQNVAYSQNAFDRFVPTEHTGSENHLDNIAAVERPTVTTVFRAAMTQSDAPVVGALSIPSIGVSLPILDGLTSDHLLYGAATLTNNQPMGASNYSLFGHHLKNEELLFGPILHLREGMDVYLTDKTHVYRYSVTETAIISENDTHFTEPTPEPILTLFTCDVSTPTNLRFMAKATLADTTNYVKGSSEAARFAQKN